MHEHDATAQLTQADGYNAQLNGSTSKTQTDVSMNGTSSTHPSKPKPKVSDYLVGTVLDEALANGEDLDVYWPFQSGRIDDWVQAEALWYECFNSLCKSDIEDRIGDYVLFQRLGLRRTHNESPVLLCIPSTLSRRTHERLTQLFFERLNVAAFSLIERPLAQLYAANSVQGVVIDINTSTTDITPIIDSMVQHNCHITIDVGSKDCERHLANVLRSNQPVIKAISPPEAPLEPDVLTATLEAIAAHVWQEGLIRIPLEGELAPIEDEGLTDIATILVAGKEKAVIESGLNLKKRASAKAYAAERERVREIEALDLVQTQFRGLSLTLGKERHRFCEPLFDPTLQARLRDVDGSSALSLQEAVHLAIRGVEVDYRLKAWDGVFVTGELSTLVKGEPSSSQQANESHLARGYQDWD